LQNLTGSYWIRLKAHGNRENYIEEARCDMAVGHLLLKPIWANEAISQ
jgi:hypothetical protein